MKEKRGKRGKENEKKEKERKEREESCNIREGELRAETTFFEYKIDKWL